MHSRMIFKWTLLSLSITLLFTLLALGHIDSSQAASKDDDRNAGALQAVNKDGKAEGLCPLKHTTVKASVSGSLSRVTVTQDFENPFDEKIEAVYTFPLPQAAAVDDLTMRIGERTVKAKVMRSEEAQAAYTKAKDSGQVASLLEQRRPNIFTQYVSNILPGEKVQIIISYVETLKYEDGSYEWTFPMVVGERYTPDTGSESNLNLDKGMRGGHDVSLELQIDSGVPIESLNSNTHEVEMERDAPNSAKVRLKELTTIPNKDFVLKFQVAGEQINDAVLTHHSDKGGFFTLILQPPSRVKVEDVMPKELVFVLDTSGSMEGFPLNKARETMKLALETLYPQDTFNVITFSGDTSILFDDPVPATKENVRKAQRFLDSRKSNGGTEMMKAIKAALEPSDSQHHLRITCFMTDGQVGDDMNILAEVQKHQNSRVFAMGFGYAPNRYLLNKMAQYGRGEVDYISEMGDSSMAAQRFNERIRSPLLTDVSVEWLGLTVSDVYPKNVPDLFSAKPVVLYGRYEGSGTGTIRLKGKTAGHNFVRDIPVTFPESALEHDVLATLWARRKIDDLMDTYLKTNRPGSEPAKEREEIITLGLAHKLMTQFTSFVAIDDLIVTDGGTPRSAQVPTEMSASISGGGVLGLISGGGVSASVTVTSAANSMDLASAGTSVIVTRAIDELPLLGRTLPNLITLAPGTVPAQKDQSQNESQVTISTNGQRPSANSISIDGVSANFGMVAGGESPGATTGGAYPAVTASGAHNAIANLSSISEVQVRTFYVEPELGRVPGAQVALTSRAGTNNFHGSLFNYFGNGALDANDWFTNSKGLEQAQRKLNNFGGTFGGPLKRDQLFFFGSYEGLRLRQPMTAQTYVPTIAARQTAPVVIQPFLNAFPIANGPTAANGLAEFSSSFLTPATHDVADIRVDRSGARLMLTGRYNFANSEVTHRGIGGLSLSNTNRLQSRAQMLTGSMSYAQSPRHVLELRANYSRLTVAGQYSLDEFGGATPPQLAITNNSFTFDLNQRNARLFAGSDASSTQRQINIIGTSASIFGNHAFKFGVDYRRMSPRIGVRANESGVLFDGVTQALTGVATRVTNFSHVGPLEPIFQNFSVFGQDEWRQSTRLTLSYGVRWEINPAPSNRRFPALAVDQVDDLSRVNIATPGASLWSTTYSNLAPRIGFAYSLSKQDDFILRGGAGVFYDTGHERVGNTFTDSPPFLAGGVLFNVPYVANQTVQATAAKLPFEIFAPELKLPYTLRWNVSLDREIGSAQKVGATYVGSISRRQLNTQTFFDQNTEFNFLRLVTNRSQADYRSFQLTYDRRVSNTLTASASYAWSRSTDDTSSDSARYVLVANSDLSSERSDSDFDVRHRISGFLTYEVPSLFSQGTGNRLFRNWTVTSIAGARSAKPVNVVYSVPTSFGFAYRRPNQNTGAPLFLTDVNAPGGKRINPEAFTAPASVQNGSLSRNSLRGLPLYQFDLSLRRRFSFSESLHLQFQIDAFNVLNHANFEDVNGGDLSLGIISSNGMLVPNQSFGRSASLSGSGTAMGNGFGSFYTTGGPRTVRLSLKLSF